MTAENGGALSGPKPPTEDNDSTNDNEGIGSQGERTGPPAMAEHADEESDAAREERHRRAERRHWAFEKIGGSVALFLTAVAAVGAILSAIAGFRAYDAANQAVEAARVQNEINIRPYIKITLLPDTFEIKKIEGRRDPVLSIDLKIENYGRLPAIVTVQGGLAWSTTRRHSIVDPPITSSNGGSIFLFPGQGDGHFTIMGTEGLGESDILELKRGERPRISIAASALYGPDILHLAAKATGICTIYEAKFLGEIMRLERGAPFGGEACNYAR